VSAAAIAAMRSAEAMERNARIACARSEAVYEDVPCGGCGENPTECTCDKYECSTCSELFETDEVDENGDCAACVSGRAEDRADEEWGRYITR